MRVVHRQGAHSSTRHGNTPPGGLDFFTTILPFFTICEKRRICLKAKIESARHIGSAADDSRRHFGTEHIRSALASHDAHADPHQETRSHYICRLNTRDCCLVLLLLSMLAKHQVRATRTLHAYDGTAPGYFSHSHSKQQQQSVNKMHRADHKAYAPRQGHPLQPLLRNRHVWIQLSHMSLYILRGRRHRIHHLRHHSRAGPSAANHRETCCGGRWGKSQQGKPHCFKPAPSARPLHADFWGFLLERVLDESVILTA